MIQDVKTFLEAFGKEEYISNVKALDLNITKEIYEEKYDIPYGKYFAKGGKTIPYEAKILIEEDGYTEEDLKEWQEAFYERFVFQIIEYKNPKLGSELKEQFPNVETAYRCMVSNSTKTSMPKLSICDAYFVVQIQGEFKIIYSEYFDKRQSKFTKPNDWTPIHILNFGKVVNVESYITPEEESSLKIYNAFNKQAKRK